MSREDTILLEARVAGLGGALIGALGLVIGAPALVVVFLALVMVIWGAEDLLLGYPKYALAAHRQRMAAHQCAVDLLLEAESAFLDGLYAEWSEAIGQQPEAIPLSTLHDPLLVDPTTGNLKDYAAEALAKALQAWAPPYFIAPETKIPGPQVLEYYGPLRWDPVGGVWWPKEQALENMISAPSLPDR